ncbi:MAG: hypothetical protein ABIX01_11420 [Chitinophagaceae bacterium]
MKTFKQIDCWVQVVSILVFIVLGLTMLDITFFVGYFVVGALQVISMLIHFGQGWFSNKGSSRYYYQHLTLAALVCMVLGLMIPPFAFAYFILLFFAPFMAIYYLYLCFRELQVIYARELVHLK